METKYHVNEYEDKPYILEMHKRDMESFFKEHKIWVLKNKLSQMTSKILSYRVSSKDYTDFIRNIKYLVNFGWELIFQESKFGIGLVSECQYYVKNPLYLKSDFQSAEFRQRNFGLSGFHGEITSLSLKEASDIYGTLKRFFDELSVISWQSLLDDWLYVVEEQGSMYDITQIDQNPIKTQLLISKLLEVLYLFGRSDYLVDAFKYPTMHLFAGPTALMHMDYDSMEKYNPYSWLSDIFREKTVEDYVKNLHLLYEPVEDIKSIELSNSKLFDLGVELKILIQVTWMNIQCQFLPKEWTDSIDENYDNVDELHNYIKDQLLILSPNKSKPIKLQDLFLDLFGREWKLLAYKCAIDEMVKGKICNSSQRINLVLCKMNELELIIKVCYSMHLRLKVKKSWGQLHINYSHV